jgi:hypothetical protein
MLSRSGHCLDHRCSAYIHRTLAPFSDDPLCTLVASGFSQALGFQGTVGLPRINDALNILDLRGPRGKPVSFS